MLGPAELREIHEALARAGTESGPGVQGPYLSAAFAAAMGVARALRTAGHGPAAIAEPAEPTPPPLPRP
jgi:hypothetical protein